MRFLAVILAISFVTPLVQAEEASVRAPRTVLPTDHDRVLTLVEAEREDIAQLQKQLDAATGQDEVLRLERLIGERRVQLQVEILQLRLERARELQRPDLVELLEKNIDRLVNPQPAPVQNKRVLTPQERQRQN